MYDGDGKAIWDRLYAPRRAANFGMGSDQIGHLLWRLQHGELAALNPKVVVLLIGTNNLDQNTPEEVAQGIGAVVDFLLDRLPETQILLLGLFPRGTSTIKERPTDDVDPRIAEVNQRLARLGQQDRVTFLDFGDRFLNEAGQIPRQIMPDFLHLSRQGYAIWAEALEPTLARLLDEAAD